jgi:hypothetical protein
MGRLCLVFAGAFLVRSLTDAGAIPKGAGVLLGLAYAGLWALIADRAARQGKQLQASGFAISASLIAFPLLWEATHGFKVLAPNAAALLLLAVASALMAVAWRGSMQAAAWVVTLGAITTGFALTVATAAVEMFALVMLLMGGGILWLTYGRRWHGLRWPLALAADASILLVVVLAAWPGGPPEAYSGLSPDRAMGLALGLVALYVGSFVGRILLRQRELNVFEGVQSALALLVGLGGALRIAQVSGAGSALLGVAALLGGFACYATAFGFLDKESEGAGNFLFFTSLALALVAMACLVLIDGHARTWAFVGLGLAASGFGVRHERWTLLAHGACYLTAGALASGLAASGLDAFLRPPGQARSPVTVPILLTLIALAFVHVLLTRSGTGFSWRKRLPSFTAGLWAALGLGALAVAGLSRLLPGIPPEAAALSAARTSVLAGAAAGLAAFARCWPRTELRWLVYPLLALAGLRFTFSDLPQGRPLTLFPALAAFGVALLLAPWLLRGVGQTERESVKK